MSWRVLRTAASRAYFAAHSVASQFLREAAGCDVPRVPQAHGMVCRLLQSCGVWEVSGAGRDLGNLRAQRRCADYDMADVSVEVQDVASDAVTHAEAIVEVLVPYLEGERHLPRSAAADLQRLAAQLARALESRGV